MRKFYRKKPVIVEAVQWTGKNFDEVARFVGDDFGHKKAYEDAQEIAESYGKYPLTLYENGQRTYFEQVHISDYIVKKADGSLYTSAPEHFEEEYELMYIDTEGEDMGEGSTTYMGSRDF